MLFSSMEERDPETDKWRSLGEVAEAGLEEAQAAWTKTLATWDLTDLNAKQELEKLAHEGLTEATDYLNDKLSPHLEPEWIRSELATFRASFSLETISE